MKILFFFCCIISVFGKSVNKTSYWTVASETTKKSYFHLVWPENGSINDALLKDLEFFFFWFYIQHKQKITRRRALNSCKRIKCEKKEWNKNLIFLMCIFKYKITVHDLLVIHVVLKNIVDELNLWAELNFI